MEDYYTQIISLGQSQFDVQLVERDGQQFALKRMLTGNNSHYEQLVNEAKYLSILDHPRIIKLINQNLRQDQNIYQGSLILELGQKSLLTRYLKNKGFKEEICRYYFKQLLEALYYLHNQKQICHRDIKLDNIVLDENYNLKLIDFGLATNITEQKLTKYCGTQGYMAPEIKNSYDGDKVDIFAAGVVLFQMLTKQLPLDYVKNQKMNQAKSDKLKNLFNKNPCFYWKYICDEEIYDFSPSFFKEDFKQLIHGMLQQDPNQRFRLIDCAQHQWTKGQTAEHYQVVQEMIKIENELTQPNQQRATKLRSSQRSCAEDDKRELYLDIIKEYGLKFDKLTLQKGKLNIFQDQIITNIDVKDVICEIIFRQDKFNGKFKQMTENKYEFVFYIDVIEEEENEEEDEQKQQLEQQEQQEFEKPEIIIEFCQFEEDLFIANIWNRNLNNQVFLSIFKNIEKIIKSFE